MVGGSPSRSLDVSRWERREIGGIFHEGRVQCALVRQVPSVWQQWRMVEEALLLRLEGISRRGRIETPAFRCTCPRPLLAVEIGEKTSLPLVVIRYGME